MSNNKRYGIIIGCLALFEILGVVGTLIVGWPSNINGIISRNDSDEAKPQVVYISPTPTASASPVAVDLIVHFINVDQGDSILIQGLDGSTAVIDGGWDNGMALAYLQEHNVQKIDVMMASHPHADHIGGLTQIMRAMPVGQVVTSGAIHTTTYFEDFIDTIADKRIPYYEVGPGDQIAFGTLAFDVIYGQRSTLDLNDTSLVLKLTYGDISFLFTGDAEYAAEQAMLTNSRNQLPATVLKVAHHGSSSSTQYSFAEAVGPDIAIYSAGASNQYGHPHNSTILTLMRNHVTIYGTDVHGTVVITTNGQSYSVDTEINAPTVSVESPPAAVATPTPVATLSTVGLPYDPNGPDRDCGHFTTHEQAQAFFIAAGGPGRDPHRLDGDNDGIACESLP